MAGLLLWSQTDLEDEITAEVAIRFLDDDRDGIVDATPLLRLQERSSGYIISGLQHAYPALITAITAWQADLSDIPERLRSLALNVAVAYLAKRRAAGQPDPTEAEVIAHLNQHVAQVQAAGQAFLDATRPPTS